MIMLYGPGREAWEVCGGDAVGVSNGMELGKRGERRPERGPHVVVVLGGRIEPHRTRNLPRAGHSEGIKNRGTLPQPNI